MWERMGNIPAAIQAVLFDLDGTLADSEIWWAQIDTTFLGDYGIAYAGEHHHALVGVAARRAMGFFKETYALRPPIEDLLARYHEIAVDFYAAQIPLFPHAADVVRRVRAMGLRTGLATSSDRRLAAPFLERHQLTSAFDVIVTGEQVVNAKPAPEIYLLAAQMLGVSPERCLAVEDSLSGVRAGKAAGMTVAAIPDARWSDRRHFQAEADFVLGSLPEIITLLT